MTKTSRILAVKHAMRQTQTRTVLGSLTEFNGWYENTGQDFEAVRNKLKVSKTAMQEFLAFERLPKISVLEKMEELMDEEPS